jgi:hypothetical protein
LFSPKFWHDLTCRNAHGLGIAAHFFDHPQRGWSEEVPGLPSER